MSHGLTRKLGAHMAPLPGASVSTPRYRLHRKAEQLARLVDGAVGGDAAAVGEQLLELISVDGEVPVAPEARRPGLLGEREPSRSMTIVNVP